MQIPLRLIRARALELDPSLRNLTPRQIERHERILKLSQNIFVRFGRHTITFSGLAAAMKMATATLRQHFPCLDSLLAEILGQHLLAIAAACGQIPNGTPNCARAARAAYLAATRTIDGELTEAHRLFIQQRQTLPPALLEHIETIHLRIGEHLGGPSPRETLAFLDNPNFDAARTEILLATYAATQPQPAPKPRAGDRPALPQPPATQAAKSAATLPLDPETVRACLRMTSTPPPVHARRAWG